MVRSLNEAGAERGQQNKKAPSDTGGAFWESRVCVLQRTTAPNGPPERVIMVTCMACSEWFMRAKYHATRKL